MADVEAAVEAVSRLVPATLKALHVLEFAGRHLSPTSLIQVVAAMAGRDDELKDALDSSHAVGWPDRLEPVRGCLEPAAEAACAGIAGLRAAPEAPQPIVAAYRALRNYARAAESIYPMTAFFKPVSQFFLEPSARDDAARLARLGEIDPGRDRVGVMHGGGPAGTRGGFSLYVPETYDGSRAWPLVVALHGGSGNGGAFLWSWLREARTRDFVLLAPTASGSTWSLMEPEVDGAMIDGMVEQIAGEWRIDPDRQLLTGMSDGGTFTYVAGLRGDCRFTHLAPVAAAFHPMLLGSADPERVRGLPVHIVHGAQDWMFGPEIAREAERSLAAAGADVVYREIADLSHTYPRDENGTILDWFGVTT
ncbi:phospholipase [Reyranella sp.]|uniref:carboxylesterase family protein n=1 Tax=Reyranella sp. TaxID=1929291 RepID=UPI003BA8C7DA